MVRKTLFKIERLRDTKAVIRSAMERKGMTVSDGDTFMDYAEILTRFQYADGIDWEAAYSATESYYNSRVSCIGPCVFADWRALTDVTFPACKVIGVSTFYYCTTLKNVSFPVCTTIGSDAFHLCFRLLRADFPACTVIGSGAFRGCSVLGSVSFPVCVSIGETAFRNCFMLTEAAFPACTTVGLSVFWGCSRLSLVEFPKCVSIGSYAFRNCPSLAAFYFLGSSIPTLGSSAFSGVNSQFKIYVLESMVSAFRAAPYWSSYAERITALTR